MADAHGGQLNDSRMGTRMRGEGKMAEAIRNLFAAARKKYMAGRQLPEFDLSAFTVPPLPGDQLNLF